MKLADMEVRCRHSPHFPGDSIPYINCSYLIAATLPGRKAHCTCGCKMLSQLELTVNDPTCLRFCLRKTFCPPF